MSLNFKQIVAVGVLFSVHSAAAIAATDWITLAETDNMKWEGRAGSMNFAKNKSGEEIVVATGKVTDLKTKQIYFEKWYVRVSDCRKNSGKLVTLDLDGNYKFENDFFLDGGSVASSLADLLCDDVKEADKKGLAI